MNRNYSGLNRSLSTYCACRSNWSVRRIHCWLWKILILGMGFSACCLHRYSNSNCVADISHQLLSRFLPLLERKLRKSHFQIDWIEISFCLLSKATRTSANESDLELVVPTKLHIEMYDFFAFFSIPQQYFHSVFAGWQHWLEIVFVRIGSKISNGPWNHIFLFIGTDFLSKSKNHSYRLLHF